MTVNGTCYFFFFFGSVGATLAGAVFLVFPYIIAKCIGALVQEPGQITAGPLEDTNLYAFLFLKFAIVSFIRYGLQMGYFEITSELLRVMVFQAYVKQEIGHFDNEGNITLPYPQNLQLIPTMPVG